MPETLLRTAFFGTPEFAATTLQALINAGLAPQVVVTAPDKPAGRGKHLQQSAVKQLALANNLPLLQPEKLKAPDFLDTLSAYKIDLGIVVAFRMLPELVFGMPPMGMFNLHASLLPAYRGAAPINWAIINGETQTGATTFKIEQQIDTGGIYLQRSTPVTPDMNAGALHNVLATIGADLVVETVHGLAAGTLTPTQQPQSAHPTAAPKLTRENTYLQFSQPTYDAVNFVRGLAPYPGAWTLLNGKMLKILAAKTLDETPFATAGTVRIYTNDRRQELHVACSEGILVLTEVQPEGKRAMAASDFLRGNTMPDGTTLG